MDIMKLETRQAFESATSAGVCLVDFKAPWCGPCKAQEPIMRELAGEFSQSAAIAELDVSQNRDVASRFGVYSIPTLILFREGKEMKRFVGLQPREILEQALKEAIGERQ